MADLSASSYKKLLTTASGAAPCLFCRGEGRTYHLNGQISPLAAATWISLKHLSDTKAQILYASSQTWLKHKSWRQLVSCKGAVRPLRQSSARNTVCHTSRRLRSAPQSILLSCLSHTPVLVPFKPCSPPVVRRHPANCSDKGLSEGITIY